MNPQERQKAFLEALKQLEVQYGYQVNAIVQPEQLGPVVQVRAAVILTPIQEWQQDEHQPSKPVPSR